MSKHNYAVLFVAICFFGKGLDAVSPKKRTTRVEAYKQQKCTRPLKRKSRSQKMNELRRMSIRLYQKQGARKKQEPCIAKEIQQAKDAREVWKAYRIDPRATVDGRRRMALERALARAHKFAIYGQRF